MPNAKRPRDDKDAVPTNFEDATPAYVRKNVAVWDKEILESRAARLGVPLDDVPSIDATPLFMIEAERQAHAEGRTVKEVLEQYSSELRDSSYPTPDCLLPDEVAEYLEHHSCLPKDRLAHADSCTACQTLLEASVFNAELEEELSVAVAAAIRHAKSASEIKEEGLLTNRRIDRLQSIVDEVIPSDPGVNASSDRTKTAEPHLFQRLAAGLPPALTELLVPPIALFVGAFLVLLYIDKTAAALTVPVSFVGFSAVLLASVFLFVVVERGLWSYPRPRNLLVGLIFAGVVMAFSWQDFQKTRSSIAVVFEWRCYQAESFAMSSMEHRQLTGAFLGEEDIPPNQGDFVVKVKDRTQDSATYVISLPSGPSMMVAIVQPDKGEIQWDNGNRTRQSIQLVTGIVEKPSDPTDLPELNAGGRKYAWSNLDVALPPSPGTIVLAAINPKTASVENFRVVAQRPADTRPRHTPVGHPVALVRPASISK